jgi:multidrug efflux pump subunit AcrA (membrane-fusion protein)
MIHKLKPIIILLIIAGLVGGGYWYFRQHPEAVTAIKVRLGLVSPAEAAGLYLVSGYIEADEVSVTAETTGRITAILADEGETVTAGQTIATLDTALLEAKIAQAEARIATAKAKLAQVEAGIRVEEIGEAEAAVAVAQANADAARVRWHDAITLRDNPQELDMQIEAARTALELAGLQIEANIPAKDASETMWELGQANWEYASDTHRFCRVIPGLGKKCMNVDLPEGVKQDAGVAWNLSGAEMWQAWVNLNTSFTQRDDAQTQLNDLLQLRDDPQSAQVQVAQAEAAYQAAQAAVAVAQAQLSVMEAGPRAEQVSVAEAQVSQAEAALAALRVEQEKSTLTAPGPGWVVDKLAHVGEMASAGGSLLTVANLADLTLTIYVPEPDIGLVQLGQSVPVYVDTFPGEAFAGHINFISPNAEFTPKNVQTKEERVNTVFAVKIKLDNEAQRLKPGMPADAVLAGGPEQPAAGSIEY